jgi:hypothetical protein
LSPRGICFSDSFRNLFSRAVSYQNISGFSPCADAEKLALSDVLKGRGFSRAVQVLSFCYSERASAREESAFSIFSAAPLSPGKPLSPML